MTEQNVNKTSLLPISSSRLRLMTLESENLVEVIGVPVLQTSVLGAREQIMSPAHKANPLQRKDGQKVRSSSSATRPTTRKNVPSEIGKDKGDSKPRTGLPRDGCLPQFIVANNPWFLFRYFLE